MIDQAKALLERNLADPMWRISHLYKILSKESIDDEGKLITFKPNPAQLRFVRALWNRNIISKARQRGFTTLLTIMWLDHALFNADQRCGIIAHDRESAEVIFRDKVKLAYQNLPPELLAAMPLARDSASELLFGHNNSSIRVATSMRSGTIDRLHVSEFGKVCAKYPDKAQEIITGSLPAVPLTGITVIESTSEGQEGAYYDMVQRALAAQQQGKTLTARDYRLHFFPWWDDPAYALTDADIPNVPMTEADVRYFETMEGVIGQALSPGQRAWYVSTRDSEFQGRPERMWQEYPGTIAESFQRSTEGVYYARELADARKGGRILKIPLIDGPVDTFWDIGRRDHTAIWFMQRVGMEYRFIRYHEASGEKLGYFIKYLQDTGYIWGHHYLPHDAGHQRLSDTNKSTEDMLNDLGLVNTDIVPRIDNELDGIAMARAYFGQCWFDEEGCAEGIVRLGNFKKSWNKTLGAWRSEPADDDNCHGADAFRAFAQSMEAGIYIGAGRKAASKQVRRGSWRTR